MTKTDCVCAETSARNCPVHQTNDKTAEEVCNEAWLEEALSIAEYTQNHFYFDENVFSRGFLAGLAHGRKEAADLVESLDYVLTYSEDLFSDAQTALASYKRKVGEK